MDGSEIKLVIFTDDMTSFVRDKLSHRNLFDTIDLFSTYSRLKVNHDRNSSTREYGSKQLRTRC